jgi:protein-L-isoaspartate(D-aspartate) O-methyltransferase
MPDYAAQRSNMVASQILPSGVTDSRLLEAIGAVPREAFVTAEKRSVSYVDAPIELVHRRWLLEPRTFARMLQLAEIQPTDRVLDVGCTTGYSTAVLARIAGKTTGLEEDADFVRIASELLHELGVASASIVQGALAEGYKPAAPYDVVIINGAIEAPPQRLLTQLAEGGRLVAIAQNNAAGQAVLYLNEQGHMGRRFAFDAAAPVLNGFRQPARFVF